MIVSFAFRVFLLILLFFGAVWAYHLREHELRAWLDMGEPSHAGADDLPGLRSPVDRVIDPRESRLAAVLRYEAPAAMDLPEAEEELPPEHPLPVPAILAQSIRPPQEVLAAQLASLRPPAAFFEPEEEPIMIYFDSRPAPAMPPAAAPPTAPGAPPAVQAARGDSAPPGRSVERKKADGPTSIPKSDRPFLSPATGHPVGGPGERPEPASNPSRSRVASAREPSRPAAPAAATPDRAASDRPASDRAAADRALTDRAASERPVADRAASERAAKNVNHVVRSKETLASLARRYYGNNTDQWRVIFAANQEKLQDPHNLPLGLVLSIPEATSDHPDAARARTVVADGPPAARANRGAPANLRNVSRSDRRPRGTRSGQAAVNG